MRLVQSKCTYRTPNVNSHFRDMEDRRNQLYFSCTRKPYDDDGTALTRTIVSRLKSTFRLCLTHHWKAEHLSKMALPITQIRPFTVW